MKAPAALLILFSLALASWLPSAERFQVNGRDLTLPAGFEVELAAGPPLVDRPIVADFDERGRLYVADSSGSNDKVDKQLQERPHRIRLLEDADGDGRFDRSTVFADRMMFPEGILCFDGSVFCAAPPSIWKLTDTDQDGIADLREEWFQGKTLTGCANDLHGPYRGPDGWIYWCKGAFAQQTYQLRGKTWVTRAAHIFRARPDGSGIEPVMTGGMDNPVEVAFTPGGERIFTSTFLQQPEAGRRDGLLHAVYGGVYGKVNDATAGHPRTGELLPPMTHLGPAVPSGLVRYASSAFGESYRDNLFAALFNLHKVTRHVLREEGATFRTEDSDFLSCDHTDFHPTDVLEDAEGSLLVIDTGGWYKLCCPSSQLSKPEVLGAIYRVRRKGARPASDPRGLTLPWSSLEPPDLARLLGDERPAVREEAVVRLARLGERSAAVLRETVKSSRSDEARRNAVWALTRISGEAAREGVLGALDDPHPAVRHAAIHSAGLWRDAGALPRLLPLIESGDHHHRRAAAEAAGRIGDRAALPVLLSALGEKRDRMLEHSLTYALIEIADRQGVERGLDASSSLTRRAALIALDQMEGGGLGPETVKPLLASPDPVLRDTARWIAGRRPAWGGALVGFFRDRLAEPGLPPAELRELGGLLGRFAADEAVQALLAGWITETRSPPEVVLTALSAMARSGLKETPPLWSAALPRVIERKEPRVLPQAVSTARALPAPKEAAPALRAALLGVVRDEASPVELRLEALAALPGGLDPAEPEVFGFLRENLDPSRPVNARAASTDALLKAKLSREQLLALAGSVETASPLEVQRLLPLFEKTAPHEKADEELGRRLLASLKSSAGFGGVRAEALKVVLAKYPPAVQKEGEEVLKLLDAGAGAERAHLEDILKSLPPGDVHRGHAIFNSSRAACSSCHAMGYLGGKVGPDLTTIGQIRTERDLLESLIYPSMSFVRSYEPVLVLTRQGDAHNGVLRGDTSEEVVLATGPATEVRIARPDIAEMRPGEVSVMPQGLDSQLTRQELADLLAFLKATRWGS